MAKKLIAVVNSDVPFVHGGHRLIANTLVQKLREYGYESDLIHTASNGFDGTFKGYLANMLTDVRKTGDGRPIDQIISMRYPTFAVSHPVHVCWLTHRMREYYDLWPLTRRHWRGLGLMNQYMRRAVIHRMDRFFFSRTRKIFALSQTVQKRLIRWGNFESQVLYPPPIPRDYRTEGYDNYIYTVSRLVSHKRIDLLIVALSLTQDTSIKAVIAGTGPELERLKEQAKRYGVEHRVELLGMISEEESTRHLANCRAVFFAPLMEDYGFVTLEAFLSCKAVITCHDSGGPAEIVQDGIDGYVTDAKAEQLAEKIDLLAQNETLAQTLGETGKLKAVDFSWEKAVQQLVVV